MSTNQTARRTALVSIDGAAFIPVPFHLADFATPGDFARDVVAALAWAETGHVVTGIREVGSAAPGAYCGTFNAGRRRIRFAFKSAPSHVGLISGRHLAAALSSTAMVPQQAQQQQAKARPARGTVEIFVFERDGAYWWNLSRADAGRRGPFTTDGEAAVAAARAHPRNACAYRYLCAPAVRTLAHHAKAESCHVETRTLLGDVVRRHGPFPRDSRQFSDAYHSEMSAALGHNRMRRHDDESCQRVHIVGEPAR